MILAEHLLDLAKKVKRGVKFLDKRVPTWRRVMRAHDGQFDLSDGNHCVLGTLEHHVGRLRVAARKKAAFFERERGEESGYHRLVRLFGMDENSYQYGFDTQDGEDLDDVFTSETEKFKVMEALWRAEYQQLDKV